MARFVDVVFFCFFVIHIPIAAFIDGQAVLPQHWYPRQLVELKNWYCREFLDPMMMDPPPWFSAYITTELIFQLPFFFVAAVAYYRGASEAKWIRIPVLIYTSHVSTTLLTIYYHLLMNDFSKSTFPGPMTSLERLKICSIYFPFLFMPLCIMVDACFSRAFRHLTKVKKQ